jgi:DNA-binding XRE family transcriptional regulator
MSRGGLRQPSGGCPRKAAKPEPEILRPGEEPRIERRGGLRDPPGGRPSLAGNDVVGNLIRICAAIGKTQEQAARLAGFSRQTLLNHYHAEWEQGRDHIDVAVAAKIIRMATSDIDDAPHLAAARLYALARLGWREGQSLDVKMEVGDKSNGQSALEIIEAKLAEKRERLASSRTLN